jgi:hypothetical protein
MPGQANSRARQNVERKKGPLSAMKHRFAAATILTTCLLVPVGAAAQLPRLVLNEVHVDFAVGTDQPLLKTKFNVYDPVGPTRAQFDQNVPLIGELNLETYRIELAWGRRGSGFGLNRMIDGTTDRLVYNFEPLDHMVTELAKYDVPPARRLRLQPVPAQDTTIARYRDSRAPKDIGKWKEIITRRAAYVNELKIPFGIDGRSGTRPTDCTSSIPAPPRNSSRFTAPPSRRCSL